MAELESKIIAQVNVMDKVMGKLEKQLTTFSNTLNQLNKGGLKGFAKGIEDLASAMQTVKGSAPTGEKGAEGGSNDAAVKTTGLLESVDFDFSKIDLAGWIAEQGVLANSELKEQLSVIDAMVSEGLLAAFKPLSGILEEAMKNISDFARRAMSGETFNFSELGVFIANGINAVFINFDFGSLGKNLSIWVNGLFEALVTALGNIDWFNVYNQLIDFLNNLDLETVSIVIGALMIRQIMGLHLASTALSTIGDTVSNMIGQEIATKLGLVLGDEKGIGAAVSQAGKDMGKAFANGMGAIMGDDSAEKALGEISEPIKQIAGIAAIIGGATLAVTSFFSMWENGFSWLNEVLMLIGIAIAAVGAVILGAGVGITAGVVAMVAGIVAAIATVAVLIHDNWDAICEWFSGVAEWFNVNVIIPVVTFFSGLWTTVSGFFLNLWNDIVAIWQMVSTWFSETVIEPVAAAFEFFKARICQVFEGLWIIIQAVWQLVSGWFNEHVITPVADLFSGLKTKISEIFQNVVSFVQGVWNTVSSWFNEHVITPVSNLFTDLKTKISDAFQSAVSFVLGVWNTISSWMNDHVIAPISNLFWSLYGTITGIADKIGGAIRGALAGAINTAISGVESGINFIINGINNVIKGFNKVVKWAAKIAKTSWDGIELIPTVSLNRIPGYAMGGFPQKASLFWAGELGVPELIGTVGGKTAVAGGEEITGIRDEIRSSGMTEAQLLKTAIGLLRVIAEKDTTISSDDLFRSIQSSSRNYSRRTGRAAFDF